MGRLVDCDDKAKILLATLFRICRPWMTLLPSQVESASRDGAYVDGMFLEGARWEPNGGTLDESKPKEMFCRMPVPERRKSSRFAGLRSEGLHAFAILAQGV